MSTAEHTYTLYIFHNKQVLKTSFYLQLSMREKFTEGSLLGRSQHLPGLLHRVCISPAAAGPCYSSESPPPVSGLPTTLRTLQMSPPYLLKDGFSPMGLAIAFYQSKIRLNQETGVPLTPPTSVAIAALTDQILNPSTELTLGRTLSQSTVPGSPTN